MGLREDKKEQTRDALIQAALGLFQEKGFDATTIDDVTARAGVSRRTFFRYFNSKNELVSPFRKARLQNFAASLKDESIADPLERVKFALVSLADTYERDPEVHVAIGAVVTSHPRLLLQELFVERDWEDLIVNTLVGATPTRERKREAMVMASAIVGVARHALRDWFESHGKMNLKEEGAARLDFIFSLLAKAEAFDRSEDQGASAARKTDAA